MTQVTGVLPGALLRTPSLPELQAASRVGYLLQQRFHYAYDGPAQDLDHRLVVVPRRRHGDQRLRLYSVSVSAAEAQVATRRDRAGNPVTRCRLAVVPAEVEFVLEAVVERSGVAADPLLPAAALTDPRLRRPTRLTAADPAIRRHAAALAGPDPLSTADRFSAFVHEAIAYTPGATSVTTTAAEALAGGRGVCQDSAHLMLALCRAAGLPARYVSGHLLGEGGTHAWVEVVVPDPAGARAVGIDPCNGRRTGRDYLTVAIGRDYTDVAPTSGTYQGSGHGSLTASKRLAVTLVA